MLNAKTYFLNGPLLETATNNEHLFLFLMLKVIENPCLHQSCLPCIAIDVKPLSFILYLTYPSYLSDFCLSRNLSFYFKI